MKLLVNGSNGYGQLQDVVPISYSQPTNANQMSEINLDFKIKTIACGYYHVFILTLNNELYGCGNNTQGQLGLGTTSDVSKFTKINISHLDSEIKEINCGGYYSTILTKNNGFYLTGQGTCGQLGFNNHNQLDKFTKHNFNFGIIKSVKCCGGTTIVLNENGNFYFSGCNLDDGKYNYKFKEFYCNPNIIDFLCGYGHVIMLDKFGKLFKATQKGAIQIKIDPLFGNIKQIGCSYSYYYILTDKNELYSYTLNRNGDVDHVECTLIDIKKKNKNKKNNFIINKLYSGLSTRLYFTLNNGEELYSVNEGNKEVSELKLLNNNDKEKYFYPFIGYDFTYIVNTNNPNLFSGESKEVERMMQLLKRQQDGSEFNNTFRDVAFLF